jgi:hypothetical protein
VRRHILDVDAKGGGHRHDSTRPSKTLFPAVWDDAKSISAVSATLDNAYTTSDDHEQRKQEESRSGRSCAESTIAS